MRVTFKTTANVPADIKGMEWIVARTGTVKGVPAARLIGFDSYGRERCFMATIDSLNLIGN